MWYDLTCVTAAASPKLPCFELCLVQCGRPELKRQRDSWTRHKRNSQRRPFCECNAERWDDKQTQQDPLNRYDSTSRMLLICTSLFPICFRNPISTNVSTKLREMIIWLLGSVFLSLSCECLTNPYKSCWCMLLNYWMCTMHLFCRVRKMHFWVGNGASNPSISVVPTASPCPSPCSMIFPGRSGDRPCTGKIPQAFIQFILWWCSWPSWLSWLGY